MITQSGCFGKQYNPPIDDVEEASQAVAEIIEGVEVENPGNVSPDPSSALAAQMLCATTRRVRMLTWAVALLAIYVLVKELN